MKSITLSSGSILRVGIASFVDGKNLYQGILRELKNTSVSSDTELDFNFFKDVIVTLLSSQEVERLILKCAEKSLYDDAKVTLESFEEVESRQDYIEVMAHIAWENVTPFMKALSAKYKDKLEAVVTGLK